MSCRPQELADAICNKRESPKGVIVPLSRGQRQGNQEQCPLRMSF